DVAVVGERETEVESHRAARSELVDAAEAIDGVVPVVRLDELDTLVEQGARGGRGLRVGVLSVGARGRQTERETEREEGGGECVARAPSFPVPPDPPLSREPHVSTR